MLSGFPTARDRNGNMLQMKLRLVTQAMVQAYCASARSYFFAGQIVAFGHATGLRRHAPGYLDSRGALLQLGTTIHGHGIAGDPACRIRRQESHPAGNIVRLGHTLQGLHA